MDPPKRVYVAVAIFVVLSSVFALQVAGVVTLGDSDSPREVVTETPTDSQMTPIEGGELPHDLPSGSTLVSVQSYDGFEPSNGRAYIVGPDGEEHWEWDPPNHRVFHSEMLPDGDILVAAGREVPNEDCPEEYQDAPDPNHGHSDHCIENRVLILDYDTKEPVFEYSWWDQFMQYHEVHDVTTTDDGEIAVIDMGKNRAFTVNMDGEITWEWDAVEHLDQDSEFQEEYGGPDYQGPVQDWTHMNDINQLNNGNFQMSIRNFDMLIEVDPETDEIVDVIGEPGNTDLLNHQHNPQPLPERGTVLVADSENNRIVEIDTETEEIIWQYGGTGELDWPRDADLMPNGHVLIVDTLHFEVFELNPDGDVVWTHEVRHPDGDDDRDLGLAYSAHRLDVDGQYIEYEQSTFEEEPETPGPNETVTPFLEGGSDPTDPDNIVIVYAYRVVSWGQLYLGDWVTVPAIFNAAGIVLTGFWLVGEGSLLGWRTYQEG